MKRRTWMVCLAMTVCLVLAAACACAAQGTADITVPARGVAVAAPDNPIGGGTVPLYELPDDHSAVLMEYYSGAIFEVLSLEKDGMVRVQCGQSGAAIMGYMRAQDLRYGVQAMREVPRCYMRVEMRKDAKVYAYCDVLSEVIGEIRMQQSADTHAKNEGKWVQVMRHPVEKTGNWTSGEPEQGFIQLITGMAMGTFMSRDSSWLVVPCEGELTYEQARERAIDLALENLQALAHVKEERRNREEIETFWTDIRLEWSESRGSARWEIYFQAPDDYEQAFHVYMEADGAFISVEASNG